MQWCLRNPAYSLRFLFSATIARNHATFASSNFFLARLIRTISFYMAFWLRMGKIRKSLCSYWPRFWPTLGASYVIYTIYESCWQDLVVVVDVHYVLLTYAFWTVPDTPATFLPIRHKTVFCGFDYHILCMKWMNPLLTWNWIN